MVNRYAIIEGGVVANVALAEGPLAGNWLEGPAEVGPGWLYDGGKFSPPPPPPPPSKEVQEAARRVAYVAEADPLFFKAQRGEATLGEWQAKVDEIKARYPYPAE